MIDEHNTEPVDLLAGLRTAAWLGTQTFPPIAWHIPGLVCEGLSLLAGSPKAGKSWLSLDMTLAVAAGGYALGRIKVQPRPTLLLALEDGDRRLQERMRRLNASAPLPEQLHYLTRISPGLIPSTIGAWLETLPNCGPAPFIVLDTLGKALPRASRTDTGYAADYQFISTLKAITDAWPGLSLLAVHHTRKMAAGDFLDTVSGTQGIAGGADSVLVLSRRRNESSGLLQITGRDLNEGEYALKFDGQWTLDGRDLDEAAKAVDETRATENLGDDSARIVKYAALHPEGVRAADVAKALELTDDKARQYLRRLDESGRLHKAGRGLYLPVLSAVTSVTSVTFDYDDAENVTNVTDVTHPCSACGFPMFDTGDGATTHPGCAR